MCGTNPTARRLSVMSGSNPWEVVSKKSQSGPARGTDEEEDLQDVKNRS